MKFVIKFSWNFIESFMSIKYFMKFSVSMLDVKSQRAQSLYRHTNRPTQCSRHTESTQYRWRHTTTTHVVATIQYTVVVPRRLLSART